jgi:hypothetical protein
MAIFYFIKGEEVVQMGDKKQKPKKDTKKKDSKKK